MRRISTLAALLALAVPLTAAAQGARPARPAGPSVARPASPVARPAPARSDDDPRAADDCARARQAGRACSLEFEGDQVGGDRAGGLDEFWVAPERLKHTSLIRLRQSFRGEIIRDADRL